MQFQAADYVLLGAAAFAAVVGLFRGFSGELGSVCGWAAGAVVGFYGWSNYSAFIAQQWLQVVALIFTVLSTFGLVRWFVTKFAHLALAQPTDAMLGLTVGVAKICAVAFLLLHFGIGIEYSNLLQELAPYVR